MRLRSALPAVFLLAVPTILFGSSGGGRVKSGPAIVPYQCSDGRPAEVVYESGSDYLHARALVTYDGRTVEMRAAPALYGVRYRSDGAAGDGRALAWSLRGEQAWLTESPDADGYTRDETAIARCTRLRGIAPAHSEGHGDHGGHAEGHGQDHGEHH